MAGGRKPLSPTSVSQVLSAALPTRRGVIARNSMKITEVQIKTVPNNTDDRLLAFANVVIDDCIVIHDIRLITSGGKQIISMPSKKTTARCRCGCKNHLLANFCNQCGGKLRRAGSAEPLRLFSDVVHPINPEGRNLLESAIYAAYQKAVSKENQEHRSTAA